MLTHYNGKPWFFEELYHDNNFGFEVSEVLVPEYDTGFQKLMVVDTPCFGKVLILDNIVQFAEFDEYIYHESMAHTALFSHECPKDVLIIGGGDLCIAREVLKHSCVESVTVIDIDPEVTKVAKEHFGNLIGIALHDSRLTVLHEDATKVDSMFEPESFDVILMDTTDNVGNAVSLFQGLFTMIVRALLKDDGILVRLGGSLFLQQKEVVGVAEDTACVFGEKNVSLFHFSAVATYYGGPFALVIAGKGDEPIPKDREQDFVTRWYWRVMHYATFVSPMELKKD